MRSGTRDRTTRPPGEEEGARKEGLSEVPLPHPKIASKGTGEQQGRDVSQGLSDSACTQAATASGTRPPGFNTGSNTYGLGDLGQVTELSVPQSLHWSNKRVATSLDCKVEPAYACKRLRTVCGI